jgi:hypothetical protein
VADQDAKEIQRDIEQARVTLANAVDQIAYRTNPKRVGDNLKLTVKAKLQTPQGKAVIGVSGGLVVLLLIRRVRNR